MCGGDGVESKNQTENGGGRASVAYESQRQEPVSLFRAWSNVAPSAFFLHEDGPYSVLLSSKFMLTLITKVTLLRIFLRIQ